MAKAKGEPTRAGTIERTRLDPRELVPNPRNPRRHPPAQVERLAASIRQFGQTRPVLARRENRMIVAGHGVTLACIAAGFELIDVILWDVDQPTADAFMLGDNRLGALGEDDAAATRAILKSLGFVEPGAIGYDQGEIDALLVERAAEIRVEEIAATEVQDRFWISVRGPLKSQAAALAALRRVMGEIPDVHVELGTTPVEAS